MTEDEEDLMAERETDEQPQAAQPQENVEVPSEQRAPEMIAARQVVEADEVPEVPEPASEAMVAAVDQSSEEFSAAPSAETPAPEVVEPPMASEDAAPLMAEDTAPSPGAEKPGVEEAVGPSTSEAVAASVESPATAVAPTEVAGEAAWYVIHCYSGYENKVRHNLEQRIETMGMKDRIFDVVIPTQEEIEVRDGKRRTVERHIFPGYVLVNMALSEESWYVVRNTPGVTGFVGMGNLPTALRPEEVAQIVKRMEADAPTVKVSFKLNERVRIVDGPFNDFRGTVADIDMERTKVRVMVSFFGRETPVELDFLQVEKA